MGIIVYYFGRYVAIQVTNYVVFNSQRFNLGQWYSVAFTHEIHRDPQTDLLEQAAFFYQEVYDF
jgi:hypothetical protein